jgi:hypothetical protein
LSPYERVSRLGSEKYGLKVMFKDQSLFMKILGFLLFFNKKFMTNYTTTIGSTVYFPSEKWLNERKESAAAVLAHELVHIADSKKVGSFTFSYCYLIPQVFALLSLLAIFGSPLWLITLAFLAPLPAPIRTYYELRGYAVTDAVCFKASGIFTDIEWMAGQFESSSYFFMWPFKNDIRERIAENRQLIKDGKLSKKIDFCEEIIACF